MVGPTDRINRQNTMKITKIQAREILDSRGNPTVETTVWAGDVWAKASVPSGASTGIHEAWELHDNDKKRYGGKGVLKAVKNVNTEILKALKGEDVTHQQDIDQRMIALDGTPNKSRLGANAILSVSLACIRVAAKLAKKELFSYLAQQYHFKPKSLPTPLFNVINGGKHADSGLDIQEFFIIPQKGSFAEKVRKGAEVFHVLKKQLASQGLTTAVGDEGGFAPKLKSNEHALKELAAAIKSAGYKLGVDFRLGMDAAASEFFDVKTGEYELQASHLKLGSEKIYRLYQEWAAKYHMQIVEDGCSEDDFKGWKTLTKQLGRKLILVGDDLFVTNPHRLAMGIAQKMGNAVLIKVNQIGTLTETIQAIKLAQSHKYKVVVSHRSGETCDSFIADLAAAVGADFIKTGAPSRGERLAKYNRLMEIETLIK